MPPPSCTRELDAIEDRLDRFGVAGPPGEGAVEVDEMEVFETLLLEPRRLRGRVRVEHGGGAHLAMDEANAFAVLEVDRREQDHGCHRRKLAISARPRLWLFSGWNWVPAMLSRATTAVTGPP